MAASQVDLEPLTPLDLGLAEGYSAELQLLRMASTKQPAPRTPPFSLTPP